MYSWDLKHVHCKLNYVLYCIAFVKTYLRTYVDNRMFQNDIGSEK